jgi:hypothetical protein
MANTPGALSVRLSPSWRTAAGRFAHPPVGDAIDRALFPLGQDSVRLLANATPVRTGRMRAGWRSTLVPTRHALRVTNIMPYAGFVVGGTRYQRPNLDLQRVIRQELPRMAQVAGNAALADISLKLRGG